MGVVAERWLAEYRREHDAYSRAAEEVKRQLEEALEGRALGIQMIAVRAKDPDSAGEKIVRKKYGRPAQQMTDVIGARVITLLDHSADAATARLRDRFDVEEKYSVDKTRDLKPREVGYRSTHLVIKPSVTGIDHVREILSRTLVEVQVRSTIAHAWAEIEHSHRYKGGNSVPAEIQRRFDALAGTLELVDREFTSIAADVVRHVEDLRRRYAELKDLEQSVGPLELLAAVSKLRPEARRLGPDGLLLEIEDASRLSKALQTAGIDSVDALMTAGRSIVVRKIVREYSDDVGIEPEVASAFVVLGAVVGSSDVDAFRSISKFRGDPSLITAVENNRTPAS